ncbi:MAG: hypothetical protein OEM15_02655 [Myxococcales bacterium]|nr:hypothetical protein [Myxococcales bacterium]MDH3483909.1 hypothetical protein [Myxococcales bacterium]
MLVGPGPTLGAGAEGGGAARGEFAGCSAGMGFVAGDARVGVGRGEGIEDVLAGSMLWRGASAG